MGDRIKWLLLDKRAMREWMMVPMALAIGLDVSSSLPTELAAQLPVRAVMWTQKGKVCQPHEIYVGQGHHSHRQKRTKWASPFIAGQHGTPTECLVLYANHLHEGGLVKDIDELLGKTLLCDCRTEVPCVADVLIAECYES